MRFGFIFISFVFICVFVCVNAWVYNVLGAHSCVNVKVHMSEHAMEYLYFLQGNWKNGILYPEKNPLNIKLK